MRISRRSLIVLAAALSLPGVSFAQSKKSPVVIGWLHAARLGVSPITAFKAEMAALGWKENVHYVLEHRSAGGRMDRLPTLAEELAARKPAVIVTSIATAAAAKAAPHVPIVQILGGSPVDEGLAASLARPGGMVTGITNIPEQLSEKYLELLLAAVPRIKRVRFLIDLNSDRHAELVKTARRSVDHHRVEAHIAEARDVEGLEQALLQLKKTTIDGLVVLPSPGLLPAERQRIIKFALTERWPLVAGPAVFSEEGALVSYNASSAARIRRGAYYVDRILRGAKPGDLPIEQPMTFDLIVNLKTAKLLGITPAPEIMVRATRVIE